MVLFHLGLDSSFKSYGLDPKKVAELPAFKSLPRTTKKRYLATWMSFIKQFNVSMAKPPTEKDFVDFLKAKLDAGSDSSTVRVNYSHLNFICIKLYKEKLSKFPSLKELIKSNKSTPTKETKTDGTTLDDNDDSWMEATADLGTSNQCTTENSIASLIEPSKEASQMSIASLSSVGKLILI